jgi:hypothetical protein
MGRLVAGVGIALLAAYLIAVAIASRATGATAEQWARTMTLVSGLESLAFVAGGWFFGKEIGRKAIETLGNDLEVAKRENEDAKGRQYTAESDAIKLASMAVTRVRSPQTASRGEAAGFAPEELGGGRATGERESNDDLRSLAESVLAKYGVK